MKAAIVLIVGNRDLQIFKDHLILLPQELQALFVENNDNRDFYIISKIGKLSFLEASKLLWEKTTDEMLDLFAFPLAKPCLEKTKEKLGEKSFSLYLFATMQPTPDHQDTFYVARIMQKAFERWREIDEVQLITIDKDPTSLQSLIHFFLTHFDELQRKHDEVFVESSGGTPHIRTAAYLAGLFREKKFTFIEVNPRRGSVETQTFEEFEKTVFKNIVLKMLNVYDYEGIRNLPLIDKKIKHHCQQALDHYNLTVSNNSLNNYVKRSLFSINLLIENAKVCYVQGRYADVIGRLFRIEEATWYVLFYKFLSKKGLLEGNKLRNKRYKFEEVISNEKKFENYMENVLEKNNISIDEGDKNNQKKITNTNIFLRSGKNFYPNYFKFKGEFENFYEFFKRINQSNQKKDVYYTKDGKINNLRNKSYLGHGYKGLRKEEIDKLMEPDNLFDFLDKLKVLLQEEFPAEVKLFESTFDNFNKNISNALFGKDL